MPSTTKRSTQKRQRLSERKKQVGLRDRVFSEVLAIGGQGAVDLLLSHWPAQRLAIYRKRWES